MRKKLFHLTRLSALVFLILLAAASSACSRRAQVKPASAGVETALQAPTEQAMPAVTWALTPPCGAETQCAKLMITQAGRLSRTSWSAQGLLAESAPAAPPKETRWVVDTGTPSPDGEWVAFTTLGYETGGPVMLQNIASGAWTNLIEAANNNLKDDRPLSTEFWWDVIGWFPDSQQLMIGPGDLSLVVIVNIKTFETQLIPFPGGGKGGRLFVNLAPDGSRFLFIGEDLEGAQVLSAYDIASGSISTVRSQSYEQGVLSNPRFAPDGQKIAYIVQKGQPEKGITYSLDLLPDSSGNPKTLVKGNLVMAVPMWSPDGQYIAFTRNDDQPNLRFALNGVPEPPRGNIWIVPANGGRETQVTKIDGLARSPTWASDSKTLAFVTHDGQVGMANIDQPGQIWQAAGPSADFPDLTSVFILP